MTDALERSDPHAPLLPDEETALKAMEPAATPEPPASVAPVEPVSETRDLPPEIALEVLRTNVQIASAQATLNEWLGYRNGLVKAFLLTNDLAPAESIGDIAATSRYTVVTTPEA